MKSYDSQYSNQYGGTFYCYGSSSNPWYNETTRTVTVTPASTQYRYRDRSKVYTYYFTKFNSYESSSEVMATDTISNIQHWVQYVD